MMMRQRAIEKRRRMWTFTQVTLNFNFSIMLHVQVLLLLYYHYYYPLIFYVGMTFLGSNSREKPSFYLQMSLSQMVLNAPFSK